MVEEQAEVGARGDQAEMIGMGICQVMVEFQLLPVVAMRGVEVGIGVENFVGGAQDGALR